MKRFVVGITGATGSIYGKRLVEELLKQGYDVYLTITQAGLQVVETELGIKLAGRGSEEVEQLVKAELNVPTELADQHLHYLPIRQIGASIASGSFLTQGMAVVPCSMGTLSGIAQGRSMNLLERAADVMLKEGRTLLLSPREMPLHSIHLENMLKLSQMGALIVPPMPGFYHQPQSIDDMVDFVVGKILDRLQIPHQLFERWTG